MGRVSSRRGSRRADCALLASAILALCLQATHAAELTHHVPLFPPASDWEEYDRQGLLRVISKSDVDGTVRIDAFDDDGVNHGPVALALGARRSVQLTSAHLEDGDAAKGLTGAIGAGMGDWRLEVSSEDADLEVLAYLRARNGVLTAMHDVAPLHLDSEDEEWLRFNHSAWHEIATFNQARNTEQQSLLRLTNPTAATASVSIRVGGAGAVRLTLAPGASRTLTAQQLEEGGDGLDGALGGRVGGPWGLGVIRPWRSRLRAFFP